LGFGQAGRCARYAWFFGNYRTEVAAEILKECPYLEEEDLQSALTHAALRSEEVDLTLNRAG
jgi:hypothetical protein